MDERQCQRRVGPCPKSRRDGDAAWGASLAEIAPLLETEHHNIGDILRESLEHEKQALGAYYVLLGQAEGHSVLLEEYAREMIRLEEMHLDEVNKMLRQPGEVGIFES